MPDLDMITIRVPRLTAVAVRGFLTTTLQAMKEQASAVEWDSPEVALIREALSQVITQCPEDL